MQHVQNRNVTLVILMEVQNVFKAKAKRCLRQAVKKKVIGRDEPYDQYSLNRGVPWIWQDGGLQLAAGWQKQFRRLGKQMDGRGRLLGALGPGALDCCESGEATIPCGLLARNRNLLQEQTKLVTQKRLTFRQLRFCCAADSPWFCTAAYGGRSASRCASLLRRSC